MKAFGDFRMRGKAQAITLQGFGRLALLLLPSPLRLACALSAFRTWPPCSLGAQACAFGPLCRAICCYLVQFAFYRASGSSLPCAASHVLPVLSLRPLHAVFHLPSVLLAQCASWRIICLLLLRFAAPSHAAPAARARAAALFAAAAIAFCG